MGYTTSFLWNECLNIWFDVSCCNSYCSSENFEEISLFPCFILENSCSLCCELHCSALHPPCAPLQPRQRSSHTNIRLQCQLCSELSIHVLPSSYLWTCVLLRILLWDQTLYTIWEHIFWDVSKTQKIKHCYPASWLHCLYAYVAACNEHEKM